LLFIRSETGGPRTTKKRESPIGRRPTVVNWSDPETFWLNVTNASLGLVTLIALLVVGGAVAIEVLKRVREHVASVARIEPHAMLVPGLGLTMADGGEKIEDEKKASKG
jgi:hypothetical protein